MAPRMLASWGSAFTASMVSSVPSSRTSECHKPAFAAESLKKALRKWWYCSVVVVYMKVCHIHNSWILSYISVKLQQLHNTIPWSFLESNDSRMGHPWFKIFKKTSHVFFPNPNQPPSNPLQPGPPCRPYVENVALQKHGSWIAWAGHIFLVGHVPPWHPGRCSDRKQPPPGNPKPEFDCTLTAWKRWGKK